VNGPTQLFAEFTKVRQTVGGGGKTRKFLAIVLPADAQSLDLTEKTLNSLDLRYLERRSDTGQFVQRLRQHSNVIDRNSKLSQIGLCFGGNRVFLFGRGRIHRGQKRA